MTSFPRPRWTQSPPSRVRPTVWTATSPRDPHRAKPHRSFLASDRARYGPHPLACEPPCPAGSAPAPTDPPAQPAVPPPWGRYLSPADWLRQPAALKIDRSRDGQLPPELADANAPSPASRRAPPVQLLHPPSPAQPAVQPSRSQHRSPADRLRRTAAHKIDPPPGRPASP